MRRVEESFRERIRHLLERYLESGGLREEEATEAAGLRASAIVERLPGKPGNGLQTMLFLLRESTSVLDLLAAGRERDASRLLASALRAAEAASQAQTGIGKDPSGTPIDPFDGLLYVLGANLAEAQDDRGAAERMRRGAERIAEGLRHRDEALTRFLDAFLKDR